MKAAVNYKYGPPEIVSLQTIKIPVPNNNEVLVEIHTSTVNRTDCGFRSAEYFVSRFFSGLIKPKNHVLGCEFAGIIKEIGKDVTKFKVGDDVFGYNDLRFGTHAEFMVIEEDACIALKPENLNFSEAAAVCEAAHYALVDIRAAKVQKGQKVLVNGATGGIGSSAVQLLNYFGAEVVAVCDTKNMDLVKSLGAVEVIDYTKTDFTLLKNHQFDFIFDAVGKSSFSKCKKLLKKKGIYISTELGKYGANIYLALLTPFFSSKKVLFPIPSMNQEDVLFFKSIIEEGHFKPVIDRSYSLDEIVEAYKFVETGMKTGNVIINVK